MWQIPVIFSDDSFLVLDKPAGLVVEKAQTTLKDETLSEILIKDLKINLDRGGIVHRLDKDTSGLIVVAKTQQALEVLQSQFKQRLVRKKYLCLVHGLIEKEGIVEGAISRNPQNREKFMVSEEGKEAKTGYLPLKKLQISDEKLSLIFEDYSKIQMQKIKKLKYGFFTLVEASPQTGRTHQIRVHLKYISHPIVGDDKYGGRKTARMDRRWCPRQFLHAAQIEFDHPKTQKRVKFMSNLPADLTKSLGFLAEIS